jgi:hypothetical protein
VDSTNLIGFTSSKFIPLEDLESILLVEGFHRHRIIFYLGLMVKGKSKLEILFKNSMPRLHILEVVYVNAKRLLEGQSIAVETEGSNFG